MARLVYPCCLFVFLGDHCEGSTSPRESDSRETTVSHILIKHIIQCEHDERESAMITLEIV